MFDSVKALDSQCQTLKIIFKSLKIQGARAKSNLYGL